MTSVCHLECAFYRSEDSAAPDVETYRAILPAMSTIDDAMLLGISSPHAKSGLLWQKFCEHYGKNDDDALFIKAPTVALNPTIDLRIIEKALAKLSLASPDAFGGSGASGRLSRRSGHQNVILAACQ